jgi:hypothetical protein
MNLENNIDLKISAKGRNKIFRKSPNLFKDLLHYLKQRYAIAI